MMFNQIICIVTILKLNVSIKKILKKGPKQNMRCETSKEWKSRKPLPIFIAKSSTTQCKTFTGY